jgi:TusA-related sulfurtransferase
MKEAVKAVRTLDCLGLYCPEPLFQTRENIDQIKPGEILEVITDDPAAEEDLKRFAKRAGCPLPSHPPSRAQKYCSARVFTVRSRTPRRLSTRGS